MLQFLELNSIGPPCTAIRAGPRVHLVRRAAGGRRREGAHHRRVVRVAAQLRARRRRGDRAMGANIRREDQSDGAVVLRLHPRR